MREFVCVTCRDYSEIVRPTLEKKVLRRCAVSRTLRLSGSQPTARDIQAHRPVPKSKMACKLCCIHNFFLEATILSAG